MRWVQCVQLLGDGAHRAQAVNRCGGVRLVYFFHQFCSSGRLMRAMQNSQIEWDGPIAPAVAMVGGTTCVEWGTGEVMF